jgi:hypothetical protein
MRRTAPVAPAPVVRVLVRFAGEASLASLGSTIVGPGASVDRRIDACRSGARNTLRTLVVVRTPVC